MISAKFHLKNGRYVAFAVSGHAMFAGYGQDIICASVSSALQLTVNGITEILKIAADVVVEENEISLTLPNDCDRQDANAFICAFCLQVQLLEETYPKNIKLIISEV
ncbi:MAG: ribosomal-processing cysteine protease Prp [Hydrogenoanaerobacterium sp.]